MSSEMIGSRRRSWAVGSRRRIKEGHLICYYTIVKRELMCQRRSQLRHVGLSPTQCAWAKQNACVEENLG